jgi:hypothetical protein
MIKMVEDGDPSPDQRRIPGPQPRNNSRGNQAWIRYGAAAFVPAAVATAVTWNIARHYKSPIGSDNTVLTAKVQDAVESSGDEAYNNLPTDDPKFVIQVKRFNRQKDTWAMFISYQGTSYLVTKIEDNSKKGYHLGFFIAKDLNKDGVPDDGQLVDARSGIDNIVTVTVESTSGIGGKGKSVFTETDKKAPDVYKLSRISRPELEPPTDSIGGANGYTTPRVTPHRPGGRTR